MENPRIQKYLAFLEDRNRYVNLISRRIQREQIYQLVGETVRLSKMVSGTHIVDAGSGNGLLGIPMAIHHGEREIVLLESREKKADFLHQAVRILELRNVEVVNGRLEDFHFSFSPGDTSLVARGFPRIEMLAEVLLSRVVHEILVITSLKKIDNLKIPLEKVRRTIYNIPFRDVIKILKMENVSRETT